MKNISIIEPYYGGSHKSFFDALTTQLPYNFNFLTLPARKWKWRMRMAAPFFAAPRGKHEIDLSNTDAILCSPFLDVAAFRGLLPDKYRTIPVYSYFHENQFAYPVQVNDERDFHFALTNLTTALASDSVAFNSNYNFESFLTGCNELLRMIHDMDLIGFEKELRKKTTILYPGMDFSDIDKEQNTLENSLLGSLENKVPVILWNHRWEHDKNPEFFFNTLFSLKEKGINFKLIVAGQSFRRQPEIFDKAKELLADRILNFGYVDSRSEYIQLLKCADIVISTANHEFYGMSVIEAVRSGCRPLLPNRLSYKELFPEVFLYEDHNFSDKLISYLENSEIAFNKGKELTERFSWHTLNKQYTKWLNV